MICCVCLDLGFCLISRCLFFVLMISMFWFDSCLCLDLCLCCVMGFDVRSAVCLIRCVFTCLICVCAFVLFRAFLFDLFDVFVFVCVAARLCWSLFRVLCCVFDVCAFVCAFDLLFEHCLCGFGWFVVFDVSMFVARCVLLFDLCLMLVGLFVYVSMLSWFV